MIKFRETRNAFSSIFGTLSGSDSSRSSSDEEGSSCDKELQKLGGDESLEGCAEHRFLYSTDKVILHQNRVKGIAFQLWPAAVHMCNYLESNLDNVFKCIDDVQNGRDVDVILSSSHRGAYRPYHVNVLELGAGIGLVGIFTSILFSKHDINTHVIVTDLPETMEIISGNIQANSGNIDYGKSKATALPLPWGDIAAAETVLLQFPAATAAPISQGASTSSQAPLLVVLADCVYWEHLFAILYNTLDHLARCRDAVIIMSHTKRWKKDNKFFKMCKKSLHVVMLKEEISYSDEGEGEDGDNRRTIKRVYLMYKKG